MVVARLVRKWAIIPRDNCTDMMQNDPPSDPHQSALDAADNLQEDLEAIASSDLPFARDAKRILDALDRAEKDP